MKTKLLILVLTLVGFAMTAKAQFNVFVQNSDMKQDTIGRLQLLVQYEMTALLDTGEKGKPVNETMMLEIGKNVSKFYSYSYFLLDSIFQSDIANKASQETINQHLNQYNKGKISESTINGYPSGRVTTLNEVGGCAKLRCEEVREMPKWSITEDTATVLSYPCRKAACQFKGRSWIAWFTSDIPLSEGPWKLFGLPGMILKAEDTEGHYSFVATGVEKSHANKPILFKGKKYEQMNRKAYNKTHERYYSDPIGFITTNQPGTTMTVTDQYGNPVKPRNLPFNPIER